ncbi:MAG TPA: LacI family DNA-binding transcriptional regulator [Gemmatimonadaceae bacterium]|nr:LacI family DNA-binding transcriptional regulator [Gemmatimonadaceae bacterium]
MVTIKDVAREAGVSVATISRVVNGSASVKEETRRHVLDVAARLGYSPHGAARSLITSRTNTIGALLPDLHGEFFSEVIRSIDHAAHHGGFHLLLSSSHDGEREIMTSFRAMRGRVDGLIVMSPDLDARTAVHSFPDGFPVVLLNCPADRAGYDSIVIANYEGARAAVNHLLELGHRRIAMITGRERNHDAAERLRGFRDAMGAGGVTGDAAVELSGDFAEESGYRATRELLGERERPTAIFAANDSMAIGAISALREAGVRVPEDVAVVGFDDIPMARYMNPPLTTVHVDISALGTLATDRLLEQIHEEPHGAREHRQEVVPATLIVRGSSGSRR